MHKKHKYDIFVFLSLIGFGITVYLATAHYLGFTVPCTVTKDCETVLASKYAIFLGLPLSVWGIGFYSAVIFSALMANHYLNWRKILTGLLGFGALASLIFLSLQFFVIGKVCQYCLAVDLLTVLLFILDINIEHERL